jgi:hypothetical protein
MLDNINILELKNEDFKEEWEVESLISHYKRASSI